MISTVELMISMSQFFEAKRLCVQAFREIMFKIVINKHAWVRFWEIFN